MAPILRLYSGYLRNFDQAQRTLSQCRENPLFAEFIAECETNTNGLLLDSYLIMPVQRLPRYQMLLQGLLKYTDEHHVDFADLTLAQQSITNICTEINQQRQLDENQKVVRALVEDVEGLLEVLGHSSFLIHRGHLHSIKGTSIDAFHYILFDDLLVKASQAQRTKKAGTASWVVQQAVPLARIASVTAIADMEGNRTRIAK